MKLDRDVAPQMPEAGFTHDGADPLGDGDFRLARPLIPAGRYLAKCVGTETSNVRFVGKLVPRVFFTFVVVQGPYCGTELFMAATAPLPRRAVSRGSKLFHSWLVLNNGEVPYRLDRLSLRNFHWKNFLVEVVTTKSRHDDGVGYSVVKQLLERHED